ncbi:MAG: BON domain-containing protein [Candidatus Thorarchaeota archaeon]
MSNDEEIKKNIVDLLYWDSRVDASNVEIEVEKGEVVLRGTVPTYTASEAALFDSWKPKGVVKADNQIMVKSYGQRKLPSDSEIQKRIEDMLSWNQSINDMDVKVSVASGTVSLEGYVDAYWKKLRAEQLASDVLGVLTVKNKLMIVPTKSVVDEAIAKDITLAMEKTDGINPGTIDVRVKDGKVTLSGNVKGARAYHAALECVVNTFGVVDMENNLSIK